MKSKPGDKVRYIGKDKWAEESGCIIGGVYTIKNFHGNYFRIEEDNERYILNCDCFILDDTKEKLDIILERKNE